jgi:hypothetical protein
MIDLPFIFMTVAWLLGVLTAFLLELRLRELRKKCKTCELYIEAHKIPPWEE